MNIKEFAVRNRYFLQKQVLLILTCAIGMIMYTYFTPPVLIIESVPGFSFIQSLPYDLPQYVWRFAMSFLLLGLIPFASAFICGYKPADLGFRNIQVKNRLRFWLVLIPVAVLFGITSGSDQSVASFYPYTKSLPVFMAKYGIIAPVVHSLLYFLLFYLPWEFMFRGILVFPLTDKIRSLYGKEDININGLLFITASFQAIPSALLHFGHPFSETLSALFFGIAAAVICIKTKSFVPVLVFHAFVGISLDIAIVLSTSN